MQKFDFLSYDGTNLVGYVSKAQDEKAVVQYIHGATDRAERYEEFANFLNEHGISFYALDLRGHGKNEFKRGPYVYLQPNDNERMIQDNLFLLDHIKSQTDKEVSLVGHSMGSFIARALITRTNGYKNVFLLGSMYESDAKIKLVSKALDLILKVKDYDDYVHLVDSKGMQKLPQDMINRGYITEKYQWLTSDVNVQNEIMTDLKFSKRFTVGSYRELVNLIEKAHDKNAIQYINPELRIFFLTGLLDPVANYGKDIEKMVKLYSKNTTNKIVNVIYKGLRHDLLHETKKRDVFDFISRAILEE